jgi:hypothetical protein
MWSISHIKNNMKTKTTRVRKVPIKSFTEKPHTNFANEISSDKFLDRTFYITVSIVAILSIIILIVNLTR